MDELPLPGARWGHWRWLLLLVVIAAGLGAWQITHTEAATRDSIAYTRYAWRLGVEPFTGDTGVAKTSEHHPGYPVLVHLASVPVRPAIPDDPPRAMQLSAQLVSCLAGILLVVPMYFFGCELFDRRVSFWATLLFQLLPASGRMMPDGLTEPVFLLLAASSLCAGCRAVRTRHWTWFAAAGIGAGAAYLTRAEGLLLAAVTGFVLLLMQAFRQWRHSWTLTLTNGTALIAATLLLAMPFMVTIGKLTAKPSGARMFNPSAQAAVSQEALPVHAPLPLAAWDYGPDARPEKRYGWAAYALVSMIDKSFFHVLTLPFLAGLVLFRRRSAASPAAWVPLTLMAVLLPLVYRLGQSSGYLGERHVMLVVLCGIFWAVAALAAAGAFVARRWPRVRAPLVTTAVLVLLCLAPLPKTLARLHGDRKGFREAGEWLAANAEPDAVILDPFAWASYFAGKTLVAGPVIPPNPEDYEYPGKNPVTRYVVLEESSKHEHLWYLIGPAKKLAENGTEVSRFKGRGPKGSKVVIYRIEQSRSAGERQ